MREEMRKGFVVLTREDCESIDGNVMKNRVGYKERLFETSRKGDLILRHSYISKKTENLFIDKNKGCFCCDTSLSKIKEGIWKMGEDSVKIIMVPLTYHDSESWRKGKEGRRRGGRYPRQS
jgi:hypothetical protein